MRVVPPPSQYRLKLITEYKNELVSTTDGSSVPFYQIDYKVTYLNEHSLLFSLSLPSSPPPSRCLSFSLQNLAIPFVIYAEFKSPNVSKLFVAHPMTDKNVTHRNYFVRFLFLSPTCKSTLQRPFLLS